MYCAHCGEWNTSGSQTCSQCGQALAVAPGKGTPGGRSCPMCMTVNAPEAAFCTACGARVVLQSGLDEADLDILRPPPEPAVPLSAAAQIALNLERQREVLAGNEDGPPDAARRRLAGDPPEQRSRALFGGSAPAAGNMSWLDSLRDDSPPAAPESEPDLDLRGDPAPIAAVPADSGTPDWLAQLRGAMHAPAADEREAPPPSAPVPSAADALPAWMSGPAPPDTPAMPAPADMLPAWLRFAPAPDSAAAPTDPPAPFPVDEAAASAPVPLEPSGLPAWMDSAPVAPVPAAPMPSEPSGLPLWMDSAPAPTQNSELRTQNSDEPSGLPLWMDSAPSAAAPTQSADEPSGLPAWMDSVPVAPVPTAPTPSEPSGLPAWMDSTPAPTQNSEPRTQNSEEPSGLPLWMDSAPAPTQNSALRPQNSDEPSGLPSWMDSAPAPTQNSALRPQNSDEPSGLPAWMDSAPAPATPTQNADEPSGLPAWMDSAPVAPVPAAPTPSEPSGLPLWMDSAPAPTQNSELRPQNSDEPSGLPAWMDSAPAPATPTQNADEPSGLPAWMDSTPTQNAAPSTQHSGASGLSDIALPAWLQAAGAGALPPATPPPARKPLTGKLLPLDDEDEDEATPPTVADGVIPAWMSDPVPVPSTPAADGLPAWMSGPTGTPEDHTAGPNSQAAPAADGLPAWMDSAPATQHSALSTQNSVADGFPPWMSGRPSESEVSTPADEEQAASRKPQAASESGGDFLSAADLPAWLRAVQARDHEAAAPVHEAPPAPQPLETAADELPAWLRALGGSEDEIDQASAALTAAATPPSMVRVIRARPPRAGAVQVFEQLLAAPAEPAPLVAPARNAMMAAFTPERIFAVVLLAVIGLFVALTPLNPDTINAPITEAGKAFYNTLKALPATKPVLLVYDWDASRYGEMYELSRAVTGAVVGSGHRFATISTVPEGTGFALNVTAGVIPTATTSINCGVSLSSGAYGTRYLHLGYRPGNEAGLADLINGNISDVQRYDAVCYHEVTNTPLLAAAPSLRDFGAVVLLAGDERPLRMWIEQVGSRLAGAKPAVPLLAAMPEGGRPAALPYSGGSGAMLRSAIYGLAGAQEIESLTRGGNAAPNAALGARLHTESAALLTLAGALLLAFIGGAYRWINRRSRP
ncbi:MAG: zinc ribbon domain-containing protein [Chloroflexota bacterium]|nr:zinc ribbon domain-containing protein [Chloroflexota bacterium]